jgi:hypothetical protein
LSKKGSGDGVTVNDPPHDLNLLAAFAEDRLDPDERRRVTEHLAACLECRGTLAALAHGVPTTSATVGRRGGSLLRRPQVWRPVAASVVVATGVAVRLLTVRPTTPPDATGSGAVPSTATAPANPNPPAASTAPAPAVPRAPSTGVQGPAPSVATSTDDLRARRGAERTIAGKTFHLVAGEWIDAGYDRVGDLPVVEVRTPEERTALLRRLPRLAPYAALGTRVTVVFDDVVYRFDAPSPE